jgi:hypothetical protein
MPRISSDSLGKTAAMDPVDGFIKMQVETAEKLVAMLSHAFGAIDRVSRGAELLTPAVQRVADQLIQGEVPDAWDSGGLSPSTTTLLLLVPNRE